MLDLDYSCSQIIVLVGVSVFFFSSQLILLFVFSLGISVDFGLVLFFVSRYLSCLMFTNRFVLSYFVWGLSR